MLASIRKLMDEAFRGDFSEQDWEHTIGGRHFVVEEEGVLASHASVIDRVIEVDRVPFPTGYIEGVATAPSKQRRGLGSIAMTAASEFVRERFDLGVLGTYRHTFYERLGWERWRGPTFVKRGSDYVRTEEEDDGLMVLRFGPSRNIDLHASISCEARAGDDW